MGFPYTDVNVQYACEGVTSSALLDGIATPIDLSLVPQGTPDGGVTGKFGDARGPLGNNDHFSRSNEVGTHFDIRGATSIALVYWFNLDALTQNTFGFSIIDTLVENRQYFDTRPKQDQTSPTNDSPFAFMYDGVTLNVGTLLRASLTAGAIAGTWQMLGCSYDAPSNNFRLFWGRAVGDTYYVNAAGPSVTGFDATATGVEIVSMGKFNSPTDVMNVDHMSYWKGRSFDQQDFLNHWQNGDGLAFADFDGGADNCSYRYYWKGRRGSL